MIPRRPRQDRGSFSRWSYRRPSHFPQSKLLDRHKAGRLKKSSNGDDPSVHVRRLVQVFSDKPRRSDGNRASSCWALVLHCFTPLPPAVPRAILSNLSGEMARFLRCPRESHRAGDELQCVPMGRDIGAPQQLLMTVSAVLGKAEGRGTDWHGHVSAVTVAPEFRRLGLARTLMAELERVSHNMFVSLRRRPYMQANASAPPPVGLQL